MAIALVTSAAVRNGDGLSFATTGSLNTTGATLLVMAMSSFVAGSPDVATDSKSNTWVPLTTYAGTFIRVLLAYVANPTVGTGHTFTGTQGGTGAISICVAAFSGVKTSSPLDQQNGAFTDSATTKQPGSVTPTENSELLITALTDASTTAVSINGGFTISDQVAFQSSPTKWGSAMAYLIQTTATAANPTWTQTPTDAMSVAIATFKDASPLTGGTNKLAALGVG